MQARLEGVEGEGAGERDDQLAIEDEVVGRERRQRGLHFGEEAVHGLARLGEEPDLAALFHGEAPEAVPLGLVLPAWFVGKRIDEQRFHGIKGRGVGRCFRHDGSMRRNGHQFGRSIASHSASCARASARRNS